MLARLTGRRALGAGVVLVVLLAVGVAVRIGMRAESEPLDGPPAVARGGGQAVQYTAGRHQANHVVVTETALDDTRKNLRYVIDDVVRINAVAPGCVYPDPEDHTKVACTAMVDDMMTDAVSTLHMSLSDANDSVVVHNHVGPSSLYNFGYNEISLGSGKDTWTGTAQEAQIVRGDNGDDTLTMSGRPGIVYGGKGDDTIHVDGGGSADGGPGDDVLYGGSGDESLHGEQGDDTIYGGPGDDLLYGGIGDDVLHGNSGDDMLRGDNRDGGRFDGGKDELYGGPGTDKLDGGPADDVVRQD
ncbi:calcium-binding protein [Streptomyces sp. NPDC005492]|uniref:calcium-binding protein n=1 Tax=Streptomyces sp. NPDC005492 TaxID=3156883 RepID=UPI0033BE21AA